MEIASTEVVPHPHLEDILFTFRNKVSRIYREVLGLFEVNHIAISHINEKQELSIFSSTPALEYNLFKSGLWRFDKTYQPPWFTLCTQATWQSLYEEDRYDELYYIKQAKYRYPIGISLAAKLTDAYVIYSFASNKTCDHTQNIFKENHDDLYKIGQYCTNMVLPLFHDNAIFLTTLNS